MPGVRGGAAPRGFGVHESSAHLSQSLPGLCLALEDHLSRVPFLSTGLHLLVSRSQREGQAKETESCAWSFLQSCYTSFREDREVDTYPSSQLKNSSIN